MKKKLLLLLSTAFILTACGSKPTPTESESEKPADTGVPTKDGAITLTANHEGKDVRIIHEGIQQYVEDMYAADAETTDEDIIYGVREVDRKVEGYLCKGVDASTYRGSGSDRDRDNFEAVKLTWDPGEVSGQMVVKYDTSKSFDNPVTVTATGNSVSLMNLYTDTTYYWKVETADGEHDSELGSFHTLGHFRNVSCGPAYNTRDIGGKPVRGGKRIKQGVIYRGCELVDSDINKSLKHGVTLDEESRTKWKEEFHIGYEFDLRKADAIGTQEGSSLGEDVDYTRLALGSFADLWNNGKASELKQSFDIFANATTDKAVYCHCWGGADRTGTLIFILEGLLGVSFLECCMDYEFTSFDNGAHERYRDRAVQNYDFPSFIKAVKASEDYEEGKSLSDTIASWMERRCGMDASDIQALKDNLLEDNPYAVEE